MLLNRKPKSPAGLAHGDASDQVVVRKPNGMPTQTFVDASVTIVGDLRSEGDVQLDGHICGSVSCAKLIVGKDAAITGAITAEQIVVRGRITGTIRAALVILQHTARVESEITYTLLALDEGARFEGLAHHRLDPLRDEDASSALADLKRLVASPGTARACAADGSREEPASAIAADD